MLRAISFKNFIYFREHHSLEFEDGPNFIVGQNASGKTAILELIRRCLSNSANVSTSRLADKTSPAFVICKFEIREKLNKRPAEDSREVPAGCHAYSCLCIRPNRQTNTKEMYKLVCITNTDEQQQECHLEYYSSVDVYGPLPRPKSFTLPSVSTELLHILDSLLNSEHSLETLHGMMTKVMEDNQPNRESRISNCEAILQAIHNAVVVTFAIRSPGPIQWSHSKNIGEGWEHYNTASKKAEILQELLNSEDVDEKESNKIFETIIHPLKYQFKKNPDSTITVNDGVQDVRFLKVPEGIIEAKQFSLMFAHKKYQTLLLEEPARGMHPSMIQKLRDLVLRRQNQDRKIVVLFISHQPTMINLWAMNRMYVCRRKRTNDGKLKQSIFRLKSKVENIFQEQEKLKQMLYSSSALFVEGATDKTIVESVFDRVLEAEAIHGFTSEELLILQQVVSGTQVIAMDGSTPYNVLKTMGENLEIPCAFLFDSDIIFKCLPEYHPEKSDKEWRKSTLFCVRILLKRMNGNSQGCSEEKSKETKKESKKESKETKKESNETKTKSKDKKKKGTFDQVMEKTTTNGKTIQKALGLQEEDISNVKWSTVVSFIQSVVLPTTFDINEKKAEPYALPQEIQDDHERRNHLKEKKNVFIWDSGNLEDMICKSVLEFEEHQSKSSKSPPTGTFENYNEQTRKEKKKKISCENCFYVKTITRDYKILKIR